jgi:signal transduction histidine kinase/DNA-binding response OmpR family regulator
MEPTMRLLLVEDEAGDAELIMQRLTGDPSGSGMTIRFTYAQDAVTAAAMLRSQRVDVVVLDLSLPDARGLEALRRVREIAPGVPVIVLTGAQDEELAVASIRAGAQDYITKPPPDGPTLRRILRYAIERQQLIEQRNDAQQQSHRAANHWQMLAQMAALMGRAGPLGATLVDVARLVVPAAADAFVLHVAGDPEISCVVEVADLDLMRTVAMQALVRDLLGGEAAQPFIRELGSPAAPNAVHDTPVVQALLGITGMNTAIVLPVRADTTICGVVMLGSRKPPNGNIDREFARSLADRIGVALDAARMLRETQRAVGSRDRTMAIVSHDLRNALTTIRICTNALLDAEPPQIAGVRSMADIIQRSASWMLQIVQDLLDRASLDAGELALHFQAVDVGDVIRSAQVLFAGLADEDNVEFVVDIGLDLPEVSADPHRVLQVLSNLLSNAMKFTPEAGRVTVAAQRSPQPATGVTVTVSDTGVGIDEEEIKHIFDWYWQTDRHGRGGVGLGLAIAKGIVEAHGSRLKVSSTIDHGTSFSFTLPLDVTVS